MVALCGIMVLPSLTYAGPITRTGEKVSIDSAQILQGDFYGFAPSITISGKAEQDVYVMGGTVTINAPVMGDLTVLGGVVQIHGDVGGDLRVLGGEVTVGNAIGEDALVAGGTLVVLSTATIQGDLLFRGGDLTLEGDVVGSIHGVSETLRINGGIGGAVSFETAHSITLGDKAEIDGSLTYTSANEMVRAQNAVVKGEIRRMAEHTVSQSNYTLIYMYVIETCILLFIAFILYLLGRRHIESSVINEKNNLGVIGLVGLGVFLIVPFVSIVLMVSVIGVLAGIILFVAYIIALLTALAIAGIVLGMFIQKMLSKKASLNASTVLYGVVAYTLLGLVPVVGPIMIFGGIIISLGGLSISFYRLIRS